MYLNKSMIACHALSDNARCYTEYSVPTKEREKDIWKLFEKFVEERKLGDTRIFIGLGDFPIINIDKNKHPFVDKYPGDKYQGIYPKKMLKIFSRSIIQSKHEDLLIPTRDFLEIIYDIEKFKKYTDHDFKKKKSIAVFRGSLTGNDRTIDNTRVQARILSLRYPSYLDVILTATFKYYMYEPGIGCIQTMIDDKRIYDDAKSWDNQIPNYEQGRRYKYTLHIDGFVSAWRLALEMLSMSTILKVDSEWIEHYYHYLKPWVHYIPIKSDLSDLIQMIQWCQLNDDICQKIAENAYNFAIEYFAEENLYDYMEHVIYNSILKFKSQSDNVILKPENFILPEIVESDQDFDFSNVTYKHYLLPTSKINVNIIENGYKLSNVPYNLFKKMRYEVEKNIRPESKKLFKHNFVKYDFDEETINEIIKKIESELKLKFKEEYRSLQFSHKPLKNNRNFFSNYKSIDIIIRLFGENIIKMESTKKKFQILMEPGIILILDSSIDVTDDENNEDFTEVLINLTMTE
jgi:hypothetical protein